MSPKPYSSGTPIVVKKYQLSKCYDTGNIYNALFDIDDEVEYPSCNAETKEMQQFVIER
jgi:hypothetical protein